MIGTRIGAAGVLRGGAESGGRSRPHEELTKREQDLLAYLPTRLTNEEIAQRLFMSVNTVKSHLKSIYRKFEVNSRDWAVTRAQELGLLAGDVHRCSCGRGWVVDHG